VEEVEMLEKLCPLLKLNPVKPAAHRDEVLAHLRACKVFHSASHGQSNPLEPSESRLVLDGEKDSITVADLRDCRHQENPPFLAYLSACSTKANEAERLVDEEIHLVGACQLAGFRHVVGTLWEVSDRYCVDVARVLYETIRDEGMTDDVVCRGLHRAIRALRDKDLATTHTRESYANGNVKVSRDETSDDKVAIEEDGTQLGIKKSGGHTSNIHDKMTAAPVGAYRERVEVTHGETRTSTNRNDTVNTSGEQQRNVISRMAVMRSFDRVTGAFPVAYRSLTAL
jgi:hypothetical protein